MTRNVDRIIDANLNRVTEGLRVIEDVFRYHRDDGALQQRLKSMRHRIASAADSSPLILSRDARDDVGFASQGLLEEKRASLKDILRSNMKRAQEGLRVLEEVMKLENLIASRLMKEIRYECYELERDMELLDRKTLSRGLYLILTAPALGYGEMTRMAVCCGLPAVQLRFKEGDDTGFLEIARAMREITKGSGTRFIVNDRVDIALMAEADGVHLGRRDLPPAEARALAGDRMIIGLSTHSLSQVEQAEDEPVDYIGFGPVFTPFSKEDHEPVTGVEALKEAAARSRHPVVAIGGITRERLGALAGIPIANAACIGAVAGSPNSAEEMKSIHTILEKRYDTENRSLEGNHHQGDGGGGSLRGD